ncbi:COP23 domain-containing protein [Altericista sp. CCNU0014]|uniref:COP23 domain-containing protein n=1 Tax=Altericista sp. CCNU0014 TaxID=3082949 RepID=UPI00384AD4A1
MKRQKLALAIAFVTLSSTLAAIPIESVWAQAKSARFFCGRDATGSPATMVEPANKARKPVVLIRWKSRFFDGAGYNPAYRCAVVSKKFQDAYTKNPNFVFTTTIANSEPVICAAESRGGACTTLLYTVKRGYQDPILTMLRLEQTRAGASGPLNESSGSSSSEPGYVGVQDLIANVLESSSSTLPTPTSAISKPAPSERPTSVRPVKAPTAPAVTPRALW